MSIVRSRFSGGRVGWRVASGSAKAMLVNGTGAAASFVVQIGLANALGQDGFGTYLLVIGWLVIAQIFGKLELDSTSVRYVGSYYATRRWGLLRGYLRTSHAAVLTASIGIALVSVPAILLFWDAMEAKHASWPAALLVAFASLPVITLLLLEGSVLQGLQQYVQAQLPFNLLRPLVFGLILIIVVFAARTTLTAPMAVGANLLSALTALLLAWHWRRRATPTDVGTATPEYDRKTWAQTARSLFAVSMSQMVISLQADIIVIGFLLPTSAAAVYGAASQLTLPLMLAASSVALVAQSMIADLYSRDPARLQSLIRAVTWVSVAIVVPLAIVLIAFGRPLLGLYGEGYGDGHTVLIILTIVQLVVGLVGSLAGHLMTMTAHEREAARIIGLSALLNLALSLVLTWRFGIVGTASATLTAAVVRAVVLRIYIKREMGLSVPTF